MNRYDIALLSLLPLAGCSLGQAIDDVGVISKTLVESNEILGRSNVKLDALGAQVDESNELMLKATQTMQQSNALMTSATHAVKEGNALVLEATKTMQQSNDLIVEATETMLEIQTSMNQLMKESVENLESTNRLLAAAQEEVQRTTNQIRIINGQIGLTNERVGLIEGTNKALGEVNQNLMNLKTTNDILQGMRGKVSEIDNTNTQLSQVLNVLIGTVIAFAIAGVVLAFLYGRIPKELSQFLNHELQEIQRILENQPGFQAVSTAQRTTSGRFSSRRRQALSDSGEAPAAGGAEGASATDAAS